jgi:endo-1,4-beta-D-glucanase Y
MKIFAALFLLGVLPAPPVQPTPPAQLDWPLWTRYQDHFVQKDGRVVDYDRDNLTTSEGESYAMFFALVANDPAGFELLYRWTASNLANGDLQKNLPAWSWGRRPDGTLDVKDSNSASDADLWIAYDLLQAGRLWKRHEYTVVGDALLEQIASREVSRNHAFPVLLPAHDGFEHDDVIVTNASYMPLFLLEAAAQAQPQGPWRAMVVSLPALIQKTTVQGFAIDWFKVESDGTISPTPALDSVELHASGSYDAIRVYLWAGLTHPSTPGRDAMLKNLYGMVSYMTSHSVPPEFASEGQPIVRGIGPVSFSAALIPFLEAVHEFNAVHLQENRLTSAWVARTGLYGDPPRYYDQNLAMFALGYTEHRYRIQSNGDLEVSWRR